MASTVHRRGTASEVRRANKRHKRPCRSAPETPAGVTVTFGKRETRNHHIWRARVRWTPVLEDVAGRLISVDEYQTQLRATDASGVPIELDSGDAAIWKLRVAGDDDHAVFSPLARPRVWYYQARVRAMNRVHGARCYSAWSGWTTATQPVTGALPGPPAPTGLALTFDRVEGKRRAPWRAYLVWNEVPTWTPADGDTVDGATQYITRLAVSENGTDTINTRRHVREAKDDDADTTSFDEFHKLKRGRYYRASVRAVDIYGRKGAWSSWTAWARPRDSAAVGTAPGAPTSVATSKRGNHTWRTTWAEPADATDVDRYAIDVYVDGSLDHTEYVGTATRKHHYKSHPDDRGLAHRFYVFSEDEEGNRSTSGDSGSLNDDVFVDGGDMEDDSIPGTRVLSSGARVYGNSNQTVSNDTETTVGFNTTDYASDGYSPNLSSDTITLRGSQVSDTGVYLLIADVAWEANATGRREVKIETNVNSGGWNALKRITQGASASGQTELQCVYIGQLASQNVAVRVRAYQNSGGDLAIQAGRTNKALAVNYLGSNTKNPAVPTAPRYGKSAWY